MKINGTMKIHANLWKSTSRMNSNDVWEPSTPSNPWKHTCFHEISICHQITIMDNFWWVCDAQSTLKWTHWACRWLLGTPKEPPRQSKCAPSGAKDPQSEQEDVKVSPSCSKVTPKTPKVSSRGLQARKTTHWTSRNIPELHDFSAHRSSKTPSI